MRHMYRGSDQSSYGDRSKRMKHHHNGEEDDDDDDTFSAKWTGITHQRMGDGLAKRPGTTPHEHPRHKIMRMDHRRNPLEDELVRVTMEIEGRSIHNRVHGPITPPGSVNSFHTYLVRYRNALEKLINVSNHIDVVRMDGIKCAWMINMLMHSRVQLVVEKHEIEMYGTMNSTNHGPFYQRTLDILDRWIELITVTIGSLKQR